MIIFWISFFNLKNFFNIRKRLKIVVHPKMIFRVEVVVKTNIFRICSGSNYSTEGDYDLQIDSEFRLPKKLSNDIANITWEASPAGTHRKSNLVHARKHQRIRVLHGSRKRLGATPTTKLLHLAKAHRGKRLCYAQLCTKVIH